MTLNLSVKNAFLMPDYDIICLIDSFSYSLAFYIIKYILSWKVVNLK